MSCALPAHSERNMHIKESKKGLNYSYIFLGFFILSLVTFGIANNLQAKQFHSATTGGAALKLLEHDLKGELMRSFVDQSAQLSLHQSLYETALQGGYVSLSPCGSINGLHIWAKKTQQSDKVCIPNSHRTVKRKFSKHFEEYHKLYEPIKDIDYEITVFQKGPAFHIIGTALQNILLDLDPNKKILENTKKIL